MYFPDVNESQAAIMPASAFVSESQSKATAIHSKEECSVPYGAAAAC